MRLVWTNGVRQLGRLEKKMGAQQASPTECAAVAQNARLRVLAGKRVVSGPHGGVGVGRWGSGGWAARASRSRGGGNGPQRELGCTRQAGRRGQTGRLGRGSEVDRPEVVFLFFFFYSSSIHLCSYCMDSKLSIIYRLT